MINQLKLKLRPAKEETTPTRRIKTDVCENNKKASFYANKPKAPLAENKKILNQSQTTLPLKNPNPYKCINLKPPSTKLNTQVRDVDRLTSGHRQAIDKIFGPTKKVNAIAVVSHSMKRDKEEKEGRKPEGPTGAARYIFEDQAGSGTFGIVHKARDKQTLEKVAIKRVFQDKKYKNRELQILKILNHPNILKMKDSFYTYEADKQYLNVVMDYYPCNLYEALQKYRGKAEISRLKLKAFAYQMFRGLLYLNSINIAHRDMKPQNILVNDQTWNLIICDFGSAKRLQVGQPNLAYICSRCYRAPELIFGSTDYTTQIDMWAAGCILVEMITLEPIFRSGSNIDQLVQIIKILGSPSYEEIMEMNRECDIKKYQFPKIQPRSWEKEFYDLLNRVLKYSPAKRLTPYEALLHPFFDELRDEQLYKKLKKECDLMDLFDFKVTKEVGSSQVNSLVPKWYNR